MNYKIFIKREAQNKLLSLSKHDRLRLTERIMMLGADPTHPELDIKPLTGSQFYRLRIGKWRIIFDKNDNIKIIRIEKIKPRGDAYK